MQTSSVANTNSNSIEWAGNAPVREINSESKPNCDLEPNADSKLVIREPLIVRLHRALGPLAGGMILDAADFVTLGPIGFFFGLIVGGSIGWWISSIYGYSKAARLKWAALAGMYCTVPFTAVFPLATMVSAIGRFRERELPEDDFADDVRDQEYVKQDRV